MHHRMKLKIFFCLPMAFILYSCGTTQPSIPPLPLKNGEYEFRLGLGYPLNDFNLPTLQGQIFMGTSDRDILGISFNNFFFPCHFSYSHYWLDKIKNDGYNLQFHIGNIFTFETNPTFETDLAYSKYYADVSQSVKLGLGYFYHRFTKNYKDENINTFIPILGYLAQLYHIQMEAILYYGLTEHYIDYYNYIQKISDHQPFNEFKFLMIKY